VAGGKGKKSLIEPETHSQSKTLNQQFLEIRVEGGPSIHLEGC